MLLNFAHENFEQCVFFSFQRSFWPPEVPVFVTLDLMPGKKVLLNWFKCSLWHCVTNFFVGNIKTFYINVFIMNIWLWRLQGHLPRGIYLAQDCLNKDTLFSCVQTQILWEILTHLHISLPLSNSAPKLFIITAFDWCCRYAIFSSSISFWLPSIGIVYFYIEVRSMHPSLWCKKRITMNKLERGFESQIVNSSAYIDFKSNINAPNNLMRMEITAQPIIIIVILKTNGWQKINVHNL